MALGLVGGVVLKLFYSWQIECLKVGRFRILFVPLQHEYTYLYYRGREVA